MTNRTAVHETDEQFAHRLDLIAGMKYELVPLRSAEEAIAELPPASTVSVTCSPTKGIEATLDLTDHLRSLGHTAVPHVAARLVEGPDHVRTIAARLRSEGIEHLFLVGGDATEPVGPYDSVAALLPHLLATDHGLRSIGLTAYPDGHPLIDAPVLHEALHHKQAMLAEAGVAAYASTQMCFDAGKIADWLTAERQAGLTMPIHLGVAGVVDRTKLMTMGVRLGIGTSLRFLKKNRSAMGRLLSTGGYDPNSVLVGLSPSFAPLGINGVHCFTFNQVATTVAWQRQVLDQR